MYGLDRALVELNQTQIFIIFLMLIIMSKHID